MHKAVQCTAAAVALAAAAAAAAAVVAVHLRINYAHCLQLSRSAAATLGSDGFAAVSCSAALHGVLPE
jgi:hypothetical protein